MCEARHGVGPSESLVQKHVQRCAGYPLLTAYHMSDFHEVVVNDVGQVIGGQLVGTLVDYLVVDDVALHAHLAAYQVVHQHGATRLHLEAHHILVSLADKVLHLLGRHHERVAHHASGAGVVLEVGYLLALGIQLLRGVEGIVGLALTDELVYILLVDGAALTLPVGAIFAAEGNALVELDAQPLERLYDILLGPGNETVGVGVLNTEHHAASMLLGKQIVEKCCTHTTNMQRSCRARSESYSYCSFCHFL